MACLFLGHLGLKSDGAAFMFTQKFAIFQLLWILWVPHWVGSSYWVSASALKLSQWLEYCVLFFLKLFLSCYHADYHYTHHNFKYWKGLYCSWRVGVYRACRIEDVLFSCCMTLYPNFIVLLYEVWLCNKELSYTPEFGFTGHMFLAQKPVLMHPTNSSMFYWWDTVLCWNTVFFPPNTSHSKSEILNLIYTQNIVRPCSCDCSKLQTGTSDLFGE